MHSPSEIVGKTAMYFEQDKTSNLVRVMVTKWLDEDKYIVSLFDNPSVFYETIGWNFTMEKEKNQPKESLHHIYLQEYEKRA